MFGGAGKINGKHKKFLRKLIKGTAKPAEEQKLDDADKIDDAWDDAESTIEGYTDITPISVYVVVNTPSWP